MKFTFDRKKFAAEVARKRASMPVETTVHLPDGKRTTTRPLGMRDAALQAGTTAATLSRIEREFPPDMDTFVKLCSWMGIEPGEFFKLQKRK